MTTRKEFIVASSVAASLGSSVLASTGEVVAQSGGLPNYTFDQAGYDQIISRAAKHRHLFAAAAIGSGNVLLAMNNTLYAYSHTLNVPESDVLEVAVLYHGAAIFLAMNDTVWTKLVLPALPRISPNLRADVQSLRLSSGNPMLHRSGGGGPDQSVEGLISRGCHFFVCNNAVNGVAYQIAGALNRTPGDVYAQMTGGLVTGSSLVPAGVWAVHALQEAHFTYLQATI